MLSNDTATSTERTTTTNTASRGARLLHGDAVPSCVAQARASKVRHVLGLINALQDELCDAVGDRRETDIAGGERETYRWIEQLEHARATCARMLAGPKACADEFDAALAGLFYMAHAEGCCRPPLRRDAGWGAARALLDGFDTVVIGDVAEREWKAIGRELARVDRAGEVNDAWDAIRARIVAFEGGQGWPPVRDAVVAIAYAHEVVLAPDGAEGLDGWALGEGTFLADGDGRALAAIGVGNDVRLATSKRRKVESAAKTSRRSRR